MGLEGAFAGWHRHEGLRVRAHGAVLELPWPSHPTYPDYGFVVRRRDLDSLVAERAKSAGADVRHGMEAVRPLLNGSNGSLGSNGSTAGSMAGAELLTGAELRDKASGETEQVKARYVIVADGANSRFGRALGAKRNRNLAQGMAIRSYYASPAHDDPWIESALDITDRQGTTLPGYGWIFPLGDGKVNVGIGLLSTFRRLQEREYELAYGRVGARLARLLGR